MTPDARWVLLHGTPLNAATWAPVAAALRVRGAHVDCPDVTLAAADGYSSDALVGRIADGLGSGAGRIHLVGHSFGGEVAIDLVDRMPDAFASVTIFCSRYTPFPAFGAAAAALRAAAPRAAPDAAALRAAAPVDPGPTLTRWFRPAELAADPPAVQQARRCLETADVGAWAAALDVIATFDRPAAFARLAAPVTCIAAEFDTVGTPYEMRAMAALAREGRFRLLAGASHLSAFVDPEGLADLLLDTVKA